MAPSRYTARYNSSGMALAGHADPAALSTRLDRFARGMGFAALDLVPTDGDATPRHTSVLRPTMRPMHRTKMVRTQEWKFILNETEPPGLYRIAEVRPRERRNLAGSTGYATARRDLEKHLAAWWAW